MALESEIAYSQLNSASSTNGFIKHSVDSSGLDGVSSEFNINNPGTLRSDSIPVIDWSDLIAGDPDQRSKAIHDLAKACEEWGFFMLVNHGIPETTTNETFAAFREFVKLPEDKKKQHAPKSASDPIKYVSFDVRQDDPKQKITLWRENIKLHVHPIFHCPQEPPSFREAVLEYSEMSRKLARKLVDAFSDALQLDQHYVDQVLELDSSFQIFAANYYPPCPHPDDQSIGLLPHTDPCFFTFIMHNGVAGLQIQKDGQWLHVHSPQNTVLVNVADQLEIFTNGRWKSLNHRVLVNEERERMSLVMANGASKDAIIRPAAPLVKLDGREMYHPVKYGQHVLRLTNERLRRVDDNPSAN